MSLIDIDIPPSYTSSTRRSKSLHPPSRTSHSRSKSLDPPRQKPKQRKYVPDPIDKLDATSFGGFYHHGGPYDAARPSFNINPKFSPLAATREGNRLAWDAAPREAQLDALVKGRPLDWVGIVPPGERTMDGQVMHYEEGTDMMRELNPGGGAYKRWPHIQYHPDDLKGKGEPGYTIDKKRKAAKAAAKAAGGLGRSQSVHASGSSSSSSSRGGVFEMMPQQGGRRRDQQSLGKGDVFSPLVRQRSSSASEVVASGSRPTAAQLKDGLKRRFGSLRRSS